MECRFSVKSRDLFFLLVVLFAATLQVARADHVMVLVTASDGLVTELSALDIRKAYLGINVEVGGVTVRPIRLNDDLHLNEVFMQSVIAMSERSYERRLLSLTLKFGRPRPEEVNTPEELIQLLGRSAAGIGYMWKEDAAADPRIKIVRVLWQEQ